MGNHISSCFDCMYCKSAIEDKKDTIIWIDSNIYNSENEDTYKNYLPKLKSFNFFRFNSVKNAIDFISNNKYFEYRLSYAVVSGRLAEEFFNSYVKISEEKNIILATSVYCLNKKYHETKPYFKDAFLNTGGITIIFDKIINYILKDECGWNSIKSIPYKPDKESYGNVFMTINYRNKYELALPILIGTLINASLIEKDEISKFQNLLLSRYYKKYDNSKSYLIKPSGNKNMDIPNHLLAKFFLRLYTCENPKFYRDLNKDLSNGKFDDYHPYLFLLYNGLNKGILKPYKESELSRGGCLSIIEYDEMKYNFEQTKKDKSLKSIYYAKNFLSFSKSQNVAKKFLKDVQKGLKKILFILQKPKNKKFFISNIEIESYSEFGNKEEEVLFLPLSCFEIIDIREEKESDLEYSIVELRYLENYKEEIDSEIEKIKNDKDGENAQIKIDEFFVNSINSKFGKDVQKYYDKKNKISIKYCQMIEASPENNYFLNIIGSGFIDKINQLIYNNSNEAMIHVDDEISNMKKDEEKREERNEAMVHVDDEAPNMIDRIKKFISDISKIDNKQFDQSYSIGVCLGNFIYNFYSFMKAPNSTKLKNLASLSLAVGLPIIKLIPGMKSKIQEFLLSKGKLDIDISKISNSLNILYAVSLELYSIYSFSTKHKKNITCFYAMKRLIKLGAGVGCSFLGNFLGKLVMNGVKVYLGVSVGPMATFVIGLFTGAAVGYYGTYVADTLGDTIFGKDEFVLTSSHLYNKYIPTKYRKKYCNPNLKWNKTYLCNNVKSYIIECIINESEIIMLIMNIPNDVNEIDECLEFENKKDTNDNDDDNKSESTDLSEEVENISKIFKNEKFVGDLVIPYKGIKENCYAINFVIFGINKEKINYEEWARIKADEKNIEVVFNLSVY